MNIKGKGNRGFTLIEILLVVAIIAILAGIVIIAVNPSKQLGDTNNAQRSADVSTIMNAVYQYAIDNNGNLPTDIDAVTASSQVLGTDGAGCDSTCTNADGGATLAACLDLGDGTGGDLTATYIVDIPMDPSSGTAANTDYYINRDADDRLVVGACDPEQSATIEITR